MKQRHKKTQKTTNQPKQNVETNEDDVREDFERNWGRFVKPY